MTWGKEWPSINLDNGSKITFAGVKEPIKSLENIDIAWIDPINDLVSRTIINSDKETVTIREIYKVRNNKVPTHDPYTNPDAHIYYQCNCGAILDPGIKSFAALNNAAMNAGWKIRFGHEYYVPYCVKCGEGVE